MAVVLTTAPPLDVAEMRILHVAQPVVGGVAVVTQQLVSAGVERGYDVTFAGPHTPSLRTMLGPAISYEHVDMRRQPGPRDLGGVLRIRHLMTSADVVVAHSSKAGALCRLAGLTMRARPALVFMPHGWSWLAGGRVAGLYTWLERALGPACDAIVAVSEQELEMGEARLGRAASRLRLIVNGVDRSFFRPSPVDQVDGLVLVLGRISVQKGQDIALRAWARVPQSRRTLLRFVGPGDTGELRDLAESLGVLESVDFFGPDDDVRRHLREAEVVLVPSRWEGLALSLLEAMACGRAIVASAAAGAEALEQGTGRVVGRTGQDVSAEDLAATMADLMVDHDQTRRLGSAARVRSRDYDLNTATSAHDALWRELLHD